MSTNSKEYQRAWRKRNPQKVNSYNNREYLQRWRLKNPDYYKNRFKEKPEEHRKYLVRMALNNAVRLGKLTREPCEICGNKAEAHHPDYSKPLEVQWLCKIHHEQI